MKFALLSAVAAVGLALSSGTASAQFRGGVHHSHGHGHGRGTYTEYHPGYWHGNHYHPGHLHTYSVRPPVVYSPYNAGLYGPNPYRVTPGFSFNFGYNSGYGNRYYGRRW